MAWQKNRQAPAKQESSTVSDESDPALSSFEDADVEAGTPVIDDGAAGRAAGPPAKPSSKRIPSAISGKRYKKRDLVKLEALRPTLAR